MMDPEISRPIIDVKRYFAGGIFTMFEKFSPSAVNFTETSEFAWLRGTFIDQPNFSPETVAVPGF